MNLSEMDGKERIGLLVGLALVVVVFASSSYFYMNPPVQVWEGRVFDVYESSNGDTFILSYGEGKIKLPGIHDIEFDATYRVTYQSRTRNFASIIISIEKIDG